MHWGSGCFDIFFSVDVASTQWITPSTGQGKNVISRFLGASAFWLSSIGTGSIGDRVFKIRSPFLLILLFLPLLPSFSLLFSDLPSIWQLNAHSNTMQFHSKAKGRVLLVTCYKHHTPRKKKVSHVRLLFNIVQYFLCWLTAAVQSLQYLFTSSIPCLFPSGAPK